MTHYIVVSSNEIVKAEMERPTSDNYEYYDFITASDNFLNHCLSLPRIAIEGKHKWEVWQEVVEGKDFRFCQTDCKLGRHGCICFPYLEKWCPDAIYTAIPIEQTKSDEQRKTEWLEEQSGYIGEVKQTNSEQGEEARLYQVDFGNHLRCHIKVTSNKIEVESAIDGWGNDVPLSQVNILNLLTNDSPHEKI